MHIGVYTLFKRFFLQRFNKTIVSWHSTGNSRCTVSSACLPPPLLAMATTCEELMQWMKSDLVSYFYTYVG